MINLEKAEKILTVFDRLEDYRVAKAVMETVGGRYRNNISISERLARLEIEDAANALANAWENLPTPTQNESAE